MNWGFPLIMTGRNGQKLKPKPVTNARDDKLSTAFWRASFESRRCLIPVSAWAEPEGEAAR
jgi:putative SOS response-associated peptidase YedK